MSSELKHSRIGLASFLIVCLLAAYAIFGAIRTSYLQFNGAGFAKIGFYVSLMVALPVPFGLAMVSLFTRNRNHLFAKITLVVVGVILLFVSLTLWRLLL